MLRVRNLRVGYDHFELRANFTVEKGSLVAIVGPSGSGKTTLLNTIAGFLSPLAGVIEWEQRNISELSPGDRPISILFQDHNFFPHLSVEQNVSIGVKANLRLTSGEYHRVFSIIEKVGLEKFRNKKPSELSGGQRTRIALARVMLRSKPLLLLDEAFLGLGPALRLEMLGLLMNFVHHENMTLLIATHDIKDVIKLNQQIMFVSEGEIKAPMQVAEFLNSSDDRIKQYLGA